MAVKEANSNYKSFTFNGISAADYGVYVTDVNVFNSAERAVEYITIPGRNGSFALDHGRFENIIVEYECALGQDTDVDFATAISDFRNALAAAKGYQRLEDDMNPDEYRMAVFSKGLEAPTLNQQTATFKVEFNCKPQRYLKSGEIPRTIGGAVTNTQTKSGAVVALESDGGDTVTSLVAQIDPVQAGSGDPSPTNVRPITGWTAAAVNVAGKNLIGFKSLLDKWGSGYTDFGDGSYNVRSTGTGYREPFRFASKDIDVTLSGEITQLNGAAGWRFQLLNSSGEVVATLGSGSTTLSGKGCKLRLNYSTGGEGANFKNIQVELGTTATAYEPYKGTTTTTALGRTVYGGTLDVVTGVLTVTKLWYVVKSTDTLTYDSTSQSLRRTGLTGNHKNNTSFICSHFRRYTGGFANITNLSAMCSGHAAAFKDTSLTSLSAWKTWLDSQESAGKPLQFVAELETPQTYNLTAQEVELLTGNNTVWADTGDITITYGRDPNKIVNPTLFDASPLLEVNGYGDITLGNGGTISIANDVLVGDVVISNGGRYSFTTEPYTESFVYRDGYLEAGDIITLAPSSLHLNISTQATITDVSASKTGGYDVGLTAVKINSTNASVVISWPEETFTVGQTGNRSADVRVLIATQNAGGAIAIDVTALIRYYASNREITRTIQTPSVTAHGELIRAIRTTAELGSITAYSTAVAYTEPLYFDLDIGEAYAIEDGVPVSINNAVSFGTVLPVLKPGANTITRSETITDLKIIPRWWKV